MDTLIKSFKYLHPPTGKKYNDNDVLENAFSSPHSLKDNLIVRDEANNEYIVLSDEYAYSKLLSSTPEVNRCFHEVIYGTLPQKIKLDIDASEEDVLDLYRSNSGIFIDDLENIDPGNDVSERGIARMCMRKILSEIDCAIHDAFLSAYSDNMPDDCLLTMSSCGEEPEGYKFSYHKIINGYHVTSNMEVERFVAYYFKNNLKREFHQFIDWGVYKSIQNFRLIGAHKKGSRRVKNPVIGGDIVNTETIQNENFADYIVQSTVNTQELRSIVPESQKSHIANNEITTFDEEMIIKIANDYMADELKNHSYSGSTGGILRFDRNLPSYCDICDREHTSDNSLMLYSLPSDDGKFKHVYRKCRKLTHNGDGTPCRVYLDKYSAEVSQPITPSEIMIQKKSQFDRAAKLFQNKPVGSEVETLLKDSYGVGGNYRVNKYEEPTLRDFELTDTLFVRANMKMGKTKKLREFIANNFQDSPMTKKNIAMISFRQTFSNEMVEKFDGFQLYNDITGDIVCGSEGGKFIVQVESLHRIKVTENTSRFDLVILDESESILEQFESGLHKNFGLSWATFRWIVKTCGTLVCMDANLSRRTANVITGLRGISRETVFHWNYFKNSSEDKYKFSLDKNYWYFKLYEDVKKGKKLAVPISSLAEAKILKNGIEKRYPGTKIGFYHSKTPMSEKKLHFSDVDTYWSQYDVLIYTPTVSAGVSFEVPHFDKMYCFFTYQSCPAETCQQMMGRIRNVKSKEYDIFVNSIESRFPINTRNIKNALYDSRASLFKNTDMSLLQFEYDDNGKISFYENDYFNLWLENTRIRNMSKNNILGRLIHLLQSAGGSIDFDDGDLSDEPNMVLICAENKTQRRQIRDTENKAVAEAEELSYNEVTEIQSKFLKSDTLDDSEQNSYKKYRIRKAYNWAGNIDMKFVQIYSSPKLQRNFNNLRAIHKLGSLEESLEKIKEDERNSYEYAIECEMDGRESNSMSNLDISRIYTYNQHRAAIGFMRVFDFHDFTPNVLKSWAEVYPNLVENRMGILNTLTDLNKEYNMKMPDRGIFAKKLGESPVEKIKFIYDVLETINPVLNHTYGARIVKYTDEGTILTLRPPKALMIKPRDQISDKQLILPNINDKWEVPLEFGNDIPEEDHFDVGEAKAILRDLHANNAE